MFRNSVICALLVLQTFAQNAHATRPGTLVVDKKNYWGHNGRLARRDYKAAYVVCDGYIASPLIPNSRRAVETFINNCEITPPPGALPIIDSTENHSTHYEGYPAYVVKPEDGEQTYFVCDGFLSSSAWCSIEAHSQAQKLRRAAESRFWEAGSIPVIEQDDGNIEPNKKESEVVNYKSKRAEETPERAVQAEQVDPEQLESTSTADYTNYTTKRLKNKQVKRSQLLKPELVKFTKVPITAGSDDRSLKVLSVGEQTDNAQLTPMTREEVADKYNLDLSDFTENPE